MRPTMLSSLQAASAWTLSGFLLFTLSVLTSKPAWNQTHSATQNAPAPSNLSNTPLGRSRTPRQVTEGTAKLISHYNAQSKIRLVLGLTAPKMQEEEKFLRELQDKKSPNFHKYLTPEQWNARFAPSEQDEKAVVDWATNNGLTITKRYANRLIVDVEGTTDAVEKAFGVSINNYQVGSVTEFSNDHDPAIPAHLTGILQSVAGLNSIQKLHAPHEGDIQMKSSAYMPGEIAASGGAIHADGDSAKFAAAMKASEAKWSQASQSLKGLAKEEGGITPNVTSGYIDPTDIYSSYGYDYGALQAQGHCCNPYSLASGSPPETSIGIATAGDFANSDLQGFQSRYSYLAYNVDRVWIDGTPSCCNDETTLDVEWSLATANSFGSYLQTSHVWAYEGANTYLSTFVDIFNQMLSDGHARVFSTSWGCAEFSCWDSGTMDTVHSIFNSMVGQGWTLMVASGDQGATASCGNAVRVSYPASDPSAIAVGGTSLALYTDGTFSSETAWQGSTWSGACSSNSGGSTGGCSAKFSAPGYQTSNPYCGAGSRSVPDVSLNSGYGQNYYFNGGWGGVGGTSIAAPEVAGFIAQENAYLLAVGVGCGAGYGSTCAPIGQANYEMYYIGRNPSYPRHYPFYDTLSGCNNNDVTAAYGLGYYCAGTGYDAVTGWGSFNALQLSWGISTYLAGDFVPPSVTYSGPTYNASGNKWYNTDQTVNWSVTDPSLGSYPAVGVAGFSQAWDYSFSDSSSMANQGGSHSDLFYTGPQFPNATSGWLNLASAGQGCHRATVFAWDNTGITSGNQYYPPASAGSICYDTVAPTIVASNLPVRNSYGWNNQNVQIILTPSDSGGSNASGINRTYYAINGSGCNAGNLGACSVYSGHFSITSEGRYTLTDFTQDVAGNFSAMGSTTINIDKTAPSTASSLAGTLSGGFYNSAVKITLSASDALSGVLGTHYQQDGGSVLSYSSPITISTPGTHNVRFYSADKAGNTESTKSVSFTIHAPTSTVLSASPASAGVGKPVSLTAHVTTALSGTPTGNVVFKNGSTVLGTVAASSGVATLTTSSLPAGADVLTASFQGSSLYLASTSAAITEKITQNTSTLLTSSVNPSAYGQQVILTAKVTPAVNGTPYGSVNFYAGTYLLGTATVSGGVAKFSTYYLGVGTSSLTAVYQGTSLHNSSKSPAISHTVNKANTTTLLAASPNPSNSGQSVTFTAIVSPSTALALTGGTVTFRNGSTAIGTASVGSGGKATLSTSGLSAGSHSISAVYSGTGNYNSSTSATVTQVVH